MSSRSKPPLLEFDSVRFSYEKGRAFIDNISFGLGEGEFVGLLGSNGSGKSTIMKLGCGILKPFSGTASLWGKALPLYSSRDRAKLISYLPQTLDITVPFTVRELAGMGLYPYDIPPAMNVDEALDMVGLTDKSDAYLTDLSGGERRRTFIAMTLVQGAGLLLLDEPLANLDIKYQIELIRLLKKLREAKNIAVVMALHDINIALQFDTVMLVKDGSLIKAGRPDEVLSRSMLKQAFDVDVEIRQSGDKGVYISYENNF